MAQKSRGTAFILLIFGSFFALHRFYYGRYVSAILMAAAFALGVVLSAGNVASSALAPWVLWVVFDFFIIPFGGLEKHGPKEQSPEEPSPKEQFPEEPKRGSSKTAKAAFGMSAVALAKSSGPSQVPTAYPRGEGVRNINTVHKKGNKWLVTYETLHPTVGWRPDRKEIYPGISGWTTWGGGIDVRWHKI